MNFIDFFAGIGGFRKGMELAGHKCVGFCEFDEHAIASYKAIHETEGEWFAKDVRAVKGNDIPRADCWCFGFPCQDITNNGKQKGFNGEQSSLFFEVTRIIRETAEENKPSYLFIENVRNILSVNGGWDFAKVLIELDNIGYDAEWEVINSKYFGVPQSRDRTYIIGHLRGGGSREKILPIIGNNKEIDNRSRIPGSKAILIRQATKRGYIEAYIGDSINFEQPNSKTRRGRVGTMIANTLTTSCSQAVIYKNRLRKLTPRECFRLQGWDDKEYEAAAKVNQDSHLYKQAGNGVTVNVIHAIACRL